MKLLKNIIDNYISIRIVLIFIFILPFIFISNTIKDDYDIGLVGYLNFYDIVNFIKNIAISQGRIQFFVAIPLWIFCQYFSGSVFYIILNFATYSFLIFLIWFFIYNNFNKLIADNFLIIYLSTTLLTWNHSLLVSVPFYHFFTLSSGFLALILFKKVINNFNILKLFLFNILFLVSFFGPEYQSFIFITLYFIVLNNNYNFTTKFYSFNKWYFVTPYLFLFYILFYVIFKFNSLNSYDGNNLGEFKLLNFLGVLFNYPFSESILYNIFINDNSIRSSFTSWNAVQFNFFSNELNLYSFKTNKYAIFTYLIFVLICVKILLGDYNDKFKFIFDDNNIFKFSFTLGFLLFFPILLIAITSKYQFWYSLGVYHYANSFISQFIFCFILAIFSLFFYHHSFTKILFIFSVVFFSYFSFAVNYGLSEAMTSNSQKWTKLDIIAKFILKNNLSEKINLNNVSFPFINFQHGSTPTSSSYISNYFNLKYNINFVLNEDNNTDSSSFFINPILAEDCELSLINFVSNSNSYYFLNSPQGKLNTFYLYGYFHDSLDNKISNSLFSYYSFQNFGRSLIDLKLFLPNNFHPVNISCFPNKNNINYINNIDLSYIPILYFDLNKIYNDVSLNGWDNPEAWGRWSNISQPHINYNSQIKFKKIKVFFNGLSNINNDNSFFKYFYINSNKFDLNKNLILKNSYISNCIDVSDFENFDIYFQSYKPRIASSSDSRLLSISLSTWGITECHL